MGTPHFQVRPGNPDFLDLPWDGPVNEWANQRLVDMPTGIHRHPVVFVAYDEGVFVIKELPGVSPRASTTCSVLSRTGRRGPRNR